MTQHPDHPVIAVLGLDPDKHEMPPLLTHHLMKIQKDFNITFVSEADPDIEIVKSLKSLIALNGFIPKVKTKILDAKGNKIT